MARGTLRFSFGLPEPMGRDHGALAKSKSVSDLCVFTNGVAGGATLFGFANRW